MLLLARDVQQFRPRRRRSIQPLLRGLSLPVAGQPRFALLEHRLKRHLEPRTQGHHHVLRGDHWHCHRRAFSALGRELHRTQCAGRRCTRCLLARAIYCRRKLDWRGCQSSGAQRDFDDHRRPILRHVNRGCVCRQPLDAVFARRGRHECSTGPSLEGRRICRRRPQEESRSVSTGHCAHSHVHRLDGNRWCRFRIGGAGAYFSGYARAGLQSVVWWNP